LGVGVRDALRIGGGVEVVPVSCLARGSDHG
jgi:hypothetical protein